MSRRSLLPCQYSFKCGGRQSGAAERGDSDGRVEGEGSTYSTSAQSDVPALQKARSMMGRRRCLPWTAERELEAMERGRARWAGAVLCCAKGRGRDKCSPRPFRCCEKDELRLRRDHAARSCTHAGRHPARPEHAILPIACAALRCSAPTVMLPPDASHPAGPRPRPRRDLISSDALRRTLDAGCWTLVRTRRDQADI